MQSLKNYQLNALADLLNGSPKWYHSGGKYGYDGYTEQWDSTDAGSYIVTLDGSHWSLTYIVGGADHGIISEEEIGVYDYNIDARLAAYGFEADERGRIEYAEARYMDMMEAEGPHPDDLPKEEPEGDPLYGGWY